MNDLKTRTKNFTLNTFTLIDTMNQYSVNTKTIMHQLSRSASSVGANYRATLRARSDREFCAKMNIVLEEIDESLFWLEIIQEMKLANEYLLLPLMKEANEITAMSVASLKTINKKIQNAKLRP
jgi:four helix bundle protein